MSALRNITILFLGLQAAACLADATYRTKIGFDVKGLKTNTDRRIGWLGGIRGERFLGNSQFHLGVAGFFGTPTGGSPASESLWYAGGAFGYDGKFTRSMVYEAALVVGYGVGTFKNLGIREVSYFVAEPSFSAGFNLGGGWRGTASASYLHFTGAPSFSGPCFGLRLEYRFSTSVRDLND